MRGGGGGILYNPVGIAEIIYGWGLGRKVNNQDKLYGLYQGLSIPKYNGIK